MSVMLEMSIEQMRTKFGSSNKKNKIKLSFALWFRGSDLRCFPLYIHEVKMSFPSPVDHVLSELSTMTRPSCVALHVMADVRQGCGPCDQTG